MWIVVLMMLARTPASRTAFYANSFERTPSAAQLAAIGKAAFGDRSLSASGTLSCASCHDDPDQMHGTRATPTLRYLQGTPRFTMHAIDPETGVDNGPTGGFMWDGRAQTLHEQARLPLFNPTEMANRSDDALAAKLRGTAYADPMRAAFGPHVLDDGASATKALVLALEVYQQDPATFMPFSSRYDDVLRGQATLSPREQHGKQVFDDPARGNCASCHPDTMEHGFPVFTDFGYADLGLPAHRDRGHCIDAATCNKFKTPTLRNVARKHRFMHDGSLTSLIQVVRFYAGRTPRAVRPTVEQGPPFSAHLTDAEVDD
ncbi:MAG: cytochrome-c peroxidase, partial [Deltaproteobacteria bacterium]|nr:cytochrome-c peroxidase [Deltaproteobacteria bacterium]